MTEELIEVTIETLVYGGAGLGYLGDGRAVYIPFTLPGEQILAKVTEEKRGHIKAVAKEVLVASPERISPRCIHFGVCGGCHYQHLAYTDQLRYKHQIVIEQLQRIGNISQPPVLPVKASPSSWNYRNTLQFHPTPAGKPGFLKMGSHESFAVEECYLPKEALGKVWPNLFIDPEANVLRANLRAGKNEDVLLTLESTDPLPGEFELDLPISAVHSGPEGPFLLAGDDYVVVEILGRNFKVSAGSFFQVNTELAEIMVKYLLETLQLSKTTTLFDVYCGVGLFSAFLAPRVGKCVGIEISPSACEDFVSNLDDFENVELYIGDARAALNSLTRRADVVVLDPPRSGLDVEIIDYLCKN
ncbi:MAG: class I SAM-dependent RNA methyltransferase, partial [Anaerolineaceae bacterium]|nr:class I SAM-dependent RNA methyltransferase [Anaerolineaceae bacterium]